MSSEKIDVGELEVLEFVNVVLGTDYATLSQVPTESLDRVRLIMKITDILNEHLTLTRRE